MSAFTDNIAKAYFGRNDLEVSLALKGKAVASPARPTWKIDKSSATATAEFVFEKFTAFDEVILSHDGWAIDRHKFEERVSVPANTRWHHEIVVDFEQHG